MRCWLAPLTVLIAIALSPTVAVACGWPIVRWVVPAWAEPVPTNTRIWFYADGYEHLIEGAQTSAEAFSLVEEESGEAVAVSVREIELRSNALGRVLVVVTPNEPLKPHTVYRASSTHPDLQELDTRFTTGAGEDRDPPSRPVEVERREHAQREEESACGTYSNAYIAYELDQPDKELLVAVLDDFDDFNARTLTGHAHAVTYGPESVYDGPEVGFGTGGFTGWPEGADGRSAKVHVGAFDVAGNFSGWSDSEVTLPKLPPPSCSVHGASHERSTQLFGLLLLSAALRRRIKKAARKRRESP